MGKRDGYSDETFLIGQMSGLVEQLTGQGVRTNQQGRRVPAPGDLCGCINDTHCDRTVSQRSLSVISTFIGDPSAVGPPNVAIGANMFNELFRDANQGAAPGTISFNVANNNIERQKINQLVLFAVRAQVNVALLDATALAASGPIDVSRLQKQLEDFAYQYYELKVFHTSDASDPWVDRTPLSYFARPKGDFVLIPPCKWVDRDQSMELSFAGGQFGTGAGNPPDITSSVRSFDGQASISIETLWMPDPNLCGESSWPSQICPKDKIANTPQYAGKIDTAKSLIAALSK